MGAVRRSHGVALVALAALLLLLLARLPPAPRPAPQPRPIQIALKAITTTASPVTNRTTVETTQKSSKPSPPSSVATVPKSPPAVVPKRDPNIVLTGDVYVAGHETPHPELCPALGAKLQLVVLITSAPSHSQARAAVRLTWGHYAKRKDIAMAFVLGTPPASLRPAVEAEDALYGDIIIGRSMDSYSNLTLKTLSMLEWVDTYCPRAPRLLKTDDDMFINIPKLLSFAAMPFRVNATKTIWGKVVKKSLPKRTTKSKYFVSPAQFPGKVFPDFTTGPAYLMTADCVRGLLAAAPAEPYLRLEDVFITGVLALKLGITRKHAPEFYNKKVAPHPCTIQRGLAIHMVRYHEQFDLWRKLLDGKTKCAS